MTQLPGTNTGTTRVRLERRLPSYWRVTFRPAGGIVGAGLNELNWPRPVRPGDELRVESEILEVRPSKSRPGEGLVKLRSVTLNQNSDPVQVTVANLLVPRRSAM